MRTLSFKTRSPLILGIVLLFAASALPAQEVIPDNRAQVDESIKLIVCNGLPSGTPATLQIRGKVFSLPSVSSFSYGQKYTVSRNGQNYSLYFTELPLLVIDNVDAANITRTGPEQTGDMTLKDIVGSYDHSYRAALRIRGNMSQYYPKKSYRMQIKNNQGSNMHVSLLGLRKDRRWLLLALWNEELKVVNRMSHQLWIKMHKLPFLEEDSDDNELPLASIRTRFVDLFINSTYKGVYLFTEDMDEKQLGLTASGELYKGDNESPETSFTGAATPPGPEGNVDDYYSGFEMRYKGGSRWENLHSLLNMVVNSNNATFAAEISNLVSIKSCMDYFIFINLMEALDNDDKNYYLAKYQSGDPYFFVPWDLDGTWGYTALGLRTYQYTRIETNGLFNRLLSVNPGNYKQNLAERWFALREGLLSSSELISNFNQDYHYLLSNGVYERDILVANDDYSQRGRGSALEYVRNFISKRLIFLDNYFGSLMQVGDCDFTLSASIPNDIVMKGAQVNLNGSCSGANCGDAEFYWWNDKGWSANGMTLSAAAPNEAAVNAYYFSAKKDGCPTRNLPMAVITNNDGGTDLDISFAFYGTGGIGYRDFLSTITDNGVVNLRRLDGLGANFLFHILNGQELSASNSNFFNRVSLYLYKNNQLLTGWGPESIEGSEGPYGLWGRFGSSPVEVGTGYRLDASIRRGETPLLTKSVNFSVVDEELPPLPVRLENLSAELNREGQAVLNWNTSAEDNFSKFEVEKSLSGDAWTPIGSVVSGGAIDGKGAYRFTDRERSAGLTYYRLKMIDLDGTYEHSRIVSVKDSRRQSFVYHDMSRQTVTVMNCPDLESTELVNSIGIVIKTVSGSSQGAISLEGALPGIYFVRYRTRSGEVEKDKILHVN